MRGDCGQGRPRQKGQEIARNQGKGQEIKHLVVHIQDALLSEGIAKSRKEWFTIERDGPLNLPFVDKKEPKWRFVFVPYNIVLGDDFTASKTLIMCPYIGCNSTQLIHRLKVK